jgi:hypothetical protein
MDGVDAAFLNQGTVLRRLSDFESITGRLETGGNVLDAYELESHPGDQVRLRLTSDDFQAVAFVLLAPTQPHLEPGREPFVRAVAGASARTAGSVEAQPPITLGAQGLYRVVVTSVDNQRQKRAVSRGEYRMTLLVDTAGANSQPVSGPESQKGPRFSAWESDGR